MNLLDRWLERHLAEGREIPAWLRGILDETFLWVAGGKLLLGLGVPSASVRRLAVLQATWEEMRELSGALGRPIPRLEELRTWEELDALHGTGPIPLEDLFAPGGPPPQIAAQVSPERLAAWLRDGGDVLIELALAVIDGLAAHRIRPEVFGVDATRARRELQRVRARLREAPLDDAASLGHEELARALEELSEVVGPLAAFETRPLPPRRGEIRRLLDVLHSLPPDLQRRLLPLAPLRNRTVQSRLLDRVLRSYRDQWIPPAEREVRREAEALAARDRERAVADARRAALEADRDRGVLTGRWAQSVLGALGLAVLVVTLPLVGAGEAVRRELIDPGPSLGAALAPWQTLSPWLRAPIIGVSFALAVLAGARDPVDAQVRPRQARIEAVLSRLVHLVVGTILAIIALLGVLALLLGPVREVLGW